MQTQGLLRCPRLRSSYDGGVIERMRRLNPFQTEEARRLAVLFAVVYFAQGMYALPDQTIAITFKDRGLQPDQVAYFFLLGSIPWFVKPVYGLISDFVPLFGRRRKSYLLLAAGLACLMGVIGGLSAEHPYWRLAAIYTAMGFGLAFADVLADALMVENGKAHGLTGAFQSMQWAAVTVASIAVGLLGGHFAEHRDLHACFIVAASFPLLTLLMTAYFVREPRTQLDRGAFRDTWAALREGLGERPVWLVAGFIFLYAFSPSFGPAFLFYQTDVLGFSQRFIGGLNALGSVASVIGALIYAPLSRRVPLRSLINLTIGISVATTLVYLLYRGTVSAVLIHALAGCAGMLSLLAFLDLAAKVCPSRVEATFFALLMSINNLGVQGSQSVGAHLYTVLGQGPAAYTQLVLIAAGATAVVWLLVPLVPIETIVEADRGKARPIV